jgi:DNA-binding response OmpR family regulator
MLDKYELVLKNSTILLAEDEENLRNSFKKVLLLYVNQVHTAANGEEAFEIYKQFHPDIIITDVKMPKVNGLEFIKRIRQHDHTTPIIVTSAYTDKDLLLESIKLSLVDYLVKPIKESNLIKLLEASADALLHNIKTIVHLDENNAYDYQNKLFIQNQQFINLTQKEVEFIEILLQHRGNLVTRQILEGKLYIYDEAPPSALKNLVFKLRKKIGNDLIKTVGNLGYAIKDE